MLHLNVAALDIPLRWRKPRKIFAISVTVHKTSAPRTGNGVAIRMRWICYTCAALAESRSMIDNPRTTSGLIDKLGNSVPFPAIMSPPLARMVEEQEPGGAKDKRCIITVIHCAGAEGGILCRLDAGERSFSFRSPGS